MTEVEADIAISEAIAAMKERELCKRDVCSCCGSRALRYKRIPDGPNVAGNYTHQSLDDPGASIMCEASAIFARERFFNLMRADLKQK